MLLEFFEIILALSLFFMAVPYKRRNFWNWLLLLSIAGSIIFFFYGFSLDNNQLYNFRWISYPKIRADFTLGGSQQIICMISYLLPILFWVLWLNTNWMEDGKLITGIIFALQLLALIILFSAQNFIQLMLGSSCVSILGFCLIGDSEVKKRFVFYSYIAEILLFTSLAIIYSQQTNITLKIAPDFLKNGKHRDLVSFLLLISVFIKCGMFMFQSYIIALQKISINRMLGLSILSVPLSGLIIFNKLNVLISPYWQPIYHTILVLSVLWGLVGVCWKDDIKAKILYLNMIFFSGALYFSGEFFDIIRILPLLFLLDIALCPINFYSANNLKLSENRLYWNKHKLEFIIALVTVFLFLFVCLQLNLYFTLLLALSTAIIIRSSYTLKHHELDVYQTKITFIILPLVISIAVGFYFYLPISGYSNWKVYVAFIAPYLLIPNHFLNLFSSKTNIQNADYFHRFYDNFIVSPLRLLGRILWLLVDFIVIERSLIGNLSGLFSSGANFIYRLQSQGIISWIWFLGIGLLIILLNIGSYAYE